TGVTVPTQGTVHTVSPGADLQGTMNATAAGDTVVFTPGTYTITRALTLKAGVLYQGACAAVLANATNTTTLVTVDKNDSSNIGIDGLIFDGGALALAGTAASNSVNNITVVNSTFKNLHLGGLEAGIFGVYVKNSTLDHNRFLNIQGGQGIFIYHLDR